MIKRDGHVWTQTYERGAPQGALTKGEATKEHGTTITFLPDLEIFEEISFDFETLAQRMRETAFLTKGLRIELIDERGSGERVEFRYEGGIRDFVTYLNKNKDPIHRKVVYFEGESEKRARARSRCSGTPPTRSRSSASPTTSTRPRAAPTFPASARRSPARSTTTRARRAC